MRLATAIMLFTSVASVANAQVFEFEGAELSYTYYDNQDFNFYQTHLEGSAEFGFGNGISTQLDLGTWYYEDDDDTDYWSAGLHLIYDITPQISAGAFYTFDRWNEQDYDNIGVEAKFLAAVASARPVEIEVFASHYSTRDDAFPYSFDAVGADASIDLGSGFSLNGGLLYADGDETQSAYKIGAEYALASGIRIGLESVRVEDREFSFSSFDAIGLTIGYDFGGGTTFGTRKWVDYFPTD
jgi:hypothetical protein